MTTRKKPKHIVLTSHPGRRAGAAPAIVWGAADPRLRGPIVATFAAPERRNVVGAHAGSYAVYRALAIAAGRLSPDHVPDLTNTTPAEAIGPFPQWGDPERIVALDPFGHVVAEAFKPWLDEGYDVRPTIAVTKAHINMPELKAALDAGRLRSDNRVLLPNGDVRVTKIAVEPVWHLPRVARRFGIAEPALRRALFEETGGMFPELVTRPDLEVFLPPIAGQTVYLFGDAALLGDSSTPVACRIHDECNGSDVFGSDICTCRPYLAHGIEVCIEMAQAGGLGIVVYNRKEGRALGEVTKFLVYNARKRAPGGDRAESYFERTECVAGVQDMRFQELMPDIFHWLGVRRLDRLASMSNMKYEALVRQGIEVGERVPIPDALVPADARVEIDAKKAAGYFTPDGAPDARALAEAKGRGLLD